MKVDRTAGTTFSHLNFVLCLIPFFFSIYSKLKNCVDDWAQASCCRGYSFLADKVFLKVHDMYFLDCGQVQDPPLTILIMLIAPVSIVTLLLPLLCVNLTTSDTEMPSALGLWCAAHVWTFWQWVMLILHLPSHKWFFFFLNKHYIFIFF